MHPSRASGILLISLLRELQPVFGEAEPKGFIGLLERYGSQLAAFLRLLSELRCIVTHAGGYSAAALPSSRGRARATAHGVTGVRKSPAAARRGFAGLFPPRNLIWPSGTIGRSEDAGKRPPVAGGWP
jgi:hypothetical protein